MRRMGTSNLLDCHATIDKSLLPLQTKLGAPFTTIRGRQMISGETFLASNCAAPVRILQHHVSTVNSRLSEPFSDIR